MAARQTENKSVVGFVPQSASSLIAGLRLRRQSGRNITVTVAGVAVRQLGIATDHSSVRRLEVGRWSQSG
jgi:hypothetical protein